MNERIEQIKHTLEHEDEYWYYRYPDDVPYLLQRVEDLEKENGKLDFQRERYLGMVKDLDARVEELEKENRSLYAQLQQTYERIVQIRKGGDA